MTVTTLPIGQLKPAKDNPRASVGDLAELAASIKAVGILEPLVVSENGAGYDVVLGHRRLAAAKKAGLKEVPVVVRTFSDTERAEAMIIENLQRSDLSPLEEASAFHALVQTHGYSQRKIAERIGRNQSHVSKRLALMKLPDVARAAVDAGRLHLDSALELTKLAEHPDRIERLVKQGRVAPWVVQDELADVRRQAKIDAATARLQRAGTKIVGWEDRAWDRELKRGAVRVQTENSWSQAVVKMAPKDHAKQPCHAAAIDRDGSVLEACTDPTSHGKLYAKPRRSSSGSGKTKARAEHERALSAARKDRHAAIRRLLKARLPRAGLLSRTVEELIRASHQSVQKIACELLEVQPARKKHQYGSTIDYAGPLRAWAGGSDAKLLTLGLTLWAASEEERLGFQWTSSWKEHAGYFEVLKAHGGYEPSAAEQKMLAGKAPR